MSLFEKKNQIGELGLSNPRIVIIRCLLPTGSPQRSLEVLFLTVDSL
jgi:hypothetical protein